MRTGVAADGRPSEEAWSMPSTFRSLSQPSRLTAPFTQGSLWSALLRRWERYPTCEKRTHRAAVRPSACQKSLADERPQAPWKRLTAEGGSWRVPVSRSEARNKIKSFSPATCASEKILLSPQVCESSAAGGRCVCAGAASPPSKSSEGVFRQSQRDHPRGWSRSVCRKTQIVIRSRLGLEHI